MENQEPSLDSQNAAASDSVEQLSSSTITAIQGNDSAQPARDHESLKRAIAAGVAGTVIAASSLTLLNRIDFRRSSTESPPDTQQSVIIQTEQPSSKFSIASDDQLQYHLPVSDTKQVKAASQGAEVKPTINEVPVKSQHDLIYNGQPTEYGCVPTSISMITDYWHNKDANNPTKTPQELLDLNAAQKEFDAKGMSPTDIHDELSKMGYIAEDHTNANFDQLRDSVKEGPALAIVKLNLKESGANHAVVVTSISEKGDVAINDPWTGKAYMYTQEQFTKSWGANFGEDAPTNSFVTINPK
jgi:hypothetical protein